MIITDGFTSGYNHYKNSVKKNRRIKLNQRNQTTQKYQSTNIYIYIYNIILNIYITFFI